MLYHDGLLSQPKVSIGQKLLHLHWLFVILLTLTASIGFAMLYSAAGAISIRGRRAKWCVSASACWVWW